MTCAKHNTCLADRRGSCWSTIPDCKNTLERRMEAYCYMKFGIKILEAHYWWGAWVKGSWARSRMKQSCRTSASCRLEWMKNQVIQVIQPGVTKYQMNMPVAAVAKAMRATYHSHTAVFDLRDDCKMVRQKVPGFAPVRSMGDPAFRLRRSSPKRTIDDRLSEEPLGKGRDVRSLCDRLRGSG